MLAAKHPREGERLNALAGYGILDTSLEPEFDSLTRIAAEICEAPIALVSLVDSGRQWFKSHLGTDLEETPLDLSMCAHAILQADVLVIPDTAADPRTSDMDLAVEGKQIRFYAGAPIVDPDGLPLGSFCILDTEPRDLSDRQKRLLKEFADQAMRLILMRRALDDAELAVHETHHRIKNSLQSVSAYVRLQRRTLTDEADAADVALAATEKRIASVAALHEALSYSAVGEKIDLPTYATRILSLATRDMRDGIGTALSLEPVRVSSRQAAALGTIISEFASNSARHAFPEGRHGAIRLSGKFDGDGIYVLECADDGIGLPSEPIQPRVNGGLGLRIIQGAIGQLGADELTEIESSDDGVRLGLRFTPE